MRRGFIKASQSRSANTAVPPRDTARPSQRVETEAACLFKLSDNLLLKIITLALLPKPKRGLFDLFDHSSYLSNPFGKIFDPLPFTLSHISSRLRTLFLSAPALWVTLDDSVLRSSALLSVFLVRSKEESLDIHISSYRYISLRLNQLVAHVRRWREFIIDASDFEESCGNGFIGDSDSDDSNYSKRSPIEIITDHLRFCAAPKLEYLDFGSVFVEDGEMDFILTGGTPVLNTLKVTGSPIFPSDCISLKRLSLHILPGYKSPLDYEDLREFWTYMPSLTHLQICGEIVPHWPEVPRVSAINFPSLKFLDLWPVEDEDACPTIEPHCLSALLATISAESLSHLSLSDMPPKILSSFLTNLRKGTFRFPHVTSLTWGTELTKERDIKSLAQYFPVVQTLTLDYCIIADHFLQVLHPQTDTSPVLWPTLRRLNLHSVDVALSLRNFVAARSHSGHPIHRIWLFKVRGLVSKANSEHLKWLRKNVKLGIISDQTIFKAEVTAWHKAV